MKKRNLHPATDREQLTIKRIFRYLVRHSHEEIHIKQIACECKTSGYFLTERYKTICKETIADTKEKIILLQAVKQVIQGKKTLKQVSKEFEFSSPASFSRAFKTYFSITPKQYIKQKKR